MLPAKRTNKSPSLLKRTLARFRAQEEERALSQIKPRFTTHRCAKTGEDFLREWQKKELDGRYEYVRTITDLSSISERRDRPGLFSRLTHDSGFDLSEFAYDSMSCPVCGDDHPEFFCDCGKLVCGARSRFTKSGKLDFFRCDPDCGKSCAQFGKATKISASEGASQGRRLLTGSSTKALPSPRKLITKD